MGVAYIDWSQQEFAIAAKLSGDKAMLEAYRSGKPWSFTRRHEAG
jgi:DNA polymerase I-like protein with 3'-5' exonuclease and polymerase domains